MDLRDYIRDIPNFPKPGILFKDITPLLGTPKAFRYAIDQLCEPFRDRPIDAIAAAEARGFLLAAPMALALNCPLVPLRKPGKLPFDTHCDRYDLEYGTAELHMHIDAIEKGGRVLLVDDVLATGGTMKAGVSLVQKAGGVVVGCAFLMELGFLGGRKLLEPAEIFSVLRY